MSLEKNILSERKIKKAFLNVIECLDTITLQGKKIRVDEENEVIQSYDDFISSLNFTIHPITDLEYTQLSNENDFNKYLFKKDELLILSSSKFEAELSFDVEQLYTIKIIILNNNDKYESIGFNLINEDQLNDEEHILAVEDMTELGFLFDKEIEYGGETYVIKPFNLDIFAINKETYNILEFACGESDDTLETSLIEISNFFNNL